MARLAALVPPPRHPLIRFHGVFAPHSSWRAGVVPHPAPEVAPGLRELGVMLPYTPLHHLLLKQTPGFPPALVMTSGNFSEEPIATDNGDARNATTLATSRASISRLMLFPVASRRSTSSGAIPSACACAASAAR